MTPSSLFWTNPRQPGSLLHPGGARRTLRRLKEQHQISIIVIEHRLERLVSTSRPSTAHAEEIVNEGKPESFRRLFSPVVNGSSGNWSAGEGTSSIRKQAQKVPVLSVKNLTAGYAGRDVLSGISFPPTKERRLLLWGTTAAAKPPFCLPAGDH